MNARTVNTLPLVVRLWAVQRGLCFHCDDPMLEVRRGEVSPYKLVWTREHVFPKSRHPGLDNNIVLAHRGCNSAREDQPPTDAEIAKAQTIYADLGLPFAIVHGQWAGVAAKDAALRSGLVASRIAHGWTVTRTGEITPPLPPPVNRLPEGARVELVPGKMGSAFVVVLP